MEALGRNTEARRRGSGTAAGAAGNGGRKGGAAAALPSILLRCISGPPRFHQQGKRPGRAPKRCPTSLPCPRYRRARGGRSYKERQLPVVMTIDSDTGRLEILGVVDVPRSSGTDWVFWFRCFTCAIYVLGRLSSVSSGISTAPANKQCRAWRAWSFLL